MTFRKKQAQKPVNQKIGHKKKIPVLYGTRILYYRFSFRASDYLLLVCCNFIQTNIEDIFQYPNL